MPHSEGQAALSMWPVYFHKGETIRNLPSSSRPGTLCGSYIINLGYWEELSGSSAWWSERGQKRREDLWWGTPGDEEMAKATVGRMDSLCTIGSEKWGMCGLILKSDLEKWRRPYGEEPKKLFNDSAFHIMGGKQEKKKTSQFIMRGRRSN